MKRSSGKLGLPPGSVVFTGVQYAETPTFRLIDYTPQSVTIKRLQKVDDAFPFKRKKSVTWLDIAGLHQTDVIEKIGNYFGLHPLTQEDIASTGKRADFESFDKYLFIVVKILSYNDNTNEVVADHVSFVVGNNFVLSFQERDGDLLNGIRERIRTGKGRVRRMGADFLAYVLLDNIIDRYFGVLEKIGDRIVSIEEDLNDDPQQSTLNNIHKLKRELIYLRRTIWPLRDMVNRMIKSDSRIWKKQTKVYLNDLYDHAIQAMDTAESFRDMSANMLDIYLSMMSHRMNEIMKVLTIFSSIFIPLTFVTGVYGMNFDFMPELAWKYGYLFIWGIFLSIAGGMLYYFKRKDWL
ncbi:magnesium/cobalt transporter CorA [Candidatus Woesearchaeota archaeon]|nr:magnesium/cobalt transporter CorA [Candidatus Woesearchaeota archaeon]